MHRFTLGLLAVFALLSGCTKIEKLSGDVSLKSFSIVAHSPDIIQVGNPQIGSDTIYIPILYGKYEFPLTIKHTVQGSDGTVIKGLESPEIVFHSLDDQIKFVVSAANGYSKYYYIVLREVPLDEDDYLHDPVRFAGLSSDVYLSGKLRFPDGGSGSKAEILGIEIAYPLTLKPQFEVGQNSAITGFSAGDNNWQPWENGTTELTFAEPGASFQIRVEAASGKVKEWTVSTKSIAFTPPNDNTMVDVVKFHAKETAQGSASIARMSLDQATGTITLALGNVSSFPVNIQLTVPPLSSWAELVGTDSTFTHSYASWDDVATVVILNRSTLQACQWQIRISQQIGAEHDVLSFDCTPDTPTRNGKKDIELVDRPQIYQHMREIVFYYESANILSDPAYATEPWRLTLSNIQLTLSPGATASVENLVWTTNAAGDILSLIQTPRTFTVKAEDGSEAVWKVSLISNSDAKSSFCDVTGIEVRSWLPSLTEFKNPPVEIDNPNGNIRFHIAKNLAFPFQVTPGYSLSQYATITSQNNGSLPLVFANENSVVDIEVTAQDGTTKRVYQASLVTPPKNEEANLESIVLGDPVGGLFFTTTPRIDPQQGVMTIPVTSEDAAFPLEIPHSAAIFSTNAQHSGFPVNTLRFTKSTDVVAFTITSESGVTRNWKVQLDYRPQLKNWNMNAWNNNKEPWPNKTYWATPNTWSPDFPIIDATVSTPGYGGGPNNYAALMISAFKGFIGIGKLAAGTIYTGEFKYNMGTGLSNPTLLTYFGIPFAPTAKIKGITFDASYSAGTGDSYKDSKQPTKGLDDWASATLMLVTGPETGYVFHGYKPTNTDPAQGGALWDRNTALPVAENKIFIGNSAAATTTYGHPVDAQTRGLPKGEWKRGIFLPIEYSASFTHIVITFASSAYGDYFTGTVGSELKIDNVTIVYED